MSEEVVQQTAVGVARKSESIAALAAALAKAQGAMRPASKDKANPYFKSKYADMASVWDACRGPLATNGLAVIQCVNSDGTKVEIVTTLAHSSGEWITSVLTLTPGKADVQSLGSTITYGRRFALSAIVGVTSEDDDGNAAAARTTPSISEPENKFGVCPDGYGDFSGHPWEQFDVEQLGMALEAPDLDVNYKDVIRAVLAQKKVAA